ncbi:MAG: PHP domain-containing protein [Eubacteriales bacterium]|jgi:histidinol-phosphatase (PHP family)|nr:PHP domain-containing protein [Eubacteriales bacterium]MDD3109858.1 PHP domain-containing protein [Eubacteriales bacterium]MDD3573116.1 PHP domain-containing protein [Eubacteriales bacterium]MDD4133818.1 PHP domain-containing protein [Eubacteriales bacterium]NLO12643.1 PHP domain-containing protein [Clostridiales bacterium]
MFSLSSPHNHTPYCDGRSTAGAMVQSALWHGFVSLGFSGHAKQDFDVFYAMDEIREASYIDEIKRLQSQYAGQIRIWLGMERDCHSTADRADFEYVLGSAHYLPLPDGTMLPVDGPMKMITSAIRDHFGGDGFAYAQAYYMQLGNYISDYCPDIIGHYDLLMKNNRHGELFDPDSYRYRKAATDAMDQAIKGCDLLEINTGGMARSGAHTPYPARKLLAYWQQIGGQVILAGDCHEANQIAFGYELAASMVRDTGFKKAAILGRHDTLFEWVEVV